MRKILRLYILSFFSFLFFGFKKAEHRLPLQPDEVLSLYDP
jgi:hypothetical protein